MIQAALYVIRKLKTTTVYFFIALLLRQCGLVAIGGLELRCLTLWTVPIMQRILLIPGVMIATNFILKSGTRAKIFTIALIIDAIWNLRNQVVLNGD